METIDMRIRELESLMDLNENIYFGDTVELNGVDYKVVGFNDKDSLEIVLKGAEYSRGFSTKKYVDRNDVILVNKAQ